MISHRELVRARIEPIQAGALVGPRTAAVTPAVLLAGAVVTAVAAALLASPVLLVAGPPSVWVARQVSGRHHQRRERRRADRAVVDLATQLTQQLRGGRSLASAVEQAIADVDPVLEERLRLVRRAIESGERLGLALQRANVEGLISLGLLSSSLRLLIENGGPAAVSLDRLGETLQAGVGAREEAAAQAGQATASALLLAALPMVFATLVAMVEPAVATLYLATWTGAGCIVGAGALSYASWWWIDRAVHQ